MLTEAEILAVFDRLGVVSHGHFTCTSGQHTDTYVNKDRIYPHTSEISRLCEALAERFAADGVEVVLAPAVGGCILSQWVAHHLSRLTGTTVLATYADKGSNGTFVLKRGYDALVRGKRILIIEDNLTTGGSVRQVVVLSRAEYADVVGVGALCNRGNLTASDVGEVPRLETLVTIDLQTWECEDCPLCERGEPTDGGLGKGAKR